MSAAHPSIYLFRSRSFGRSFRSFVRSVVRSCLVASPTSPVVAQQQPDGNFIDIDNNFPYREKGNIIFHPHNWCFLPVQWTRKITGVVINGCTGSCRVGVVVDCRSFVQRSVCAHAASLNLLPCLSVCARSCRRICFCWRLCVLVLAPFFLSGPSWGFFLTWKLSSSTQRSHIM